jgi:asparagine synthase (glutamine-hydrolysing)
LEDAVEAHTMSDVPVGVFLSGGMDSNTVLSLIRKGSSSPIDAFTIGFDDQENDESEIARRLARHWGVDHHELRLGKENIHLLDQVVRQFDEPFSDSSAIPSYQVSWLARRHVKVVLSGDGGDELFGGYISAQGARNIRLACQVPDWLRMQCASLMDQWMPATSLKRLKLPTWLMLASLRDHLFDPPRNQILHSPWRISLAAILDTYEPLKDSLSDLDPLNAYFAGLFAQYLPDDILTKIDRVSSAHSLEVRVPLLDHRIVELAARIPPELKFKGGKAKQIFRETMAGHLPRFISRHEKRGFGIPLSYWKQSVWMDRLQRLRKQCAAVEEIVNFSDADEWDGPLTWRVLVLATWISQERRLS